MIDTSPPAWEQTLATIEQAELSLEEAAKSLPAEKLGEGDRSFYALFYGIVQHNAYHAGQIALLKK